MLWYPTHALDLMSAIGCCGGVTVHVKRRGMMDMSFLALDLFSVLCIRPICLDLLTGWCFVIRLVPPVSSHVGVPFLQLHSMGRQVRATLLLCR